MARCRIRMLNVPTYPPSCLPNTVSSNLPEQCFYLNAREFRARGDISSNGTNGFPHSPHRTDSASHLHRRFPNTIHVVNKTSARTLSGWFDMHMPAHRFLCTMLTFSPLRCLTNLVLDCSSRSLRNNVIAKLDIAV